MKTHAKFVLGTCFVIAISAPGLLGQARQRQAPGTAAPVRPPLTRDQREDVRDRHEDVRDRLEDRIDRNPRFAARMRQILPQASARARRFPASKVKVSFTRPFMPRKTSTFLSIS